MASMRSAYSSRTNAAFAPEFCRVNMTRSSSSPALTGTTASPSFHAAK
jgi:hypothetical protein